MPLEEFLLRYWSLIGAVAFVIIWAIRIESMVKQLQKDMEDGKEQRKLDLEATNESRREVHSALIEIQRDIKNILRHQAGGHND